MGSFPSPLECGMASGRHSVFGTVNGTDTFNQNSPWAKRVLDNTLSPVVSTKEQSYGWADLINLVGVRSPDVGVDDENAYVSISSSDRIHEGFGDEPHQFGYGQVTRTKTKLAPSSPSYHTTQTGGDLSSRQI
ncbi:hypothetical protein TNCV_4428101 [Trichonephila clavipes]|nr:hypothetical protein TNCV_4428101 [Trichonephila clavipes]